MKLILQAIKAIFRKVENKLSSHRTEIIRVNDKADAAKTTAELAMSSKMNSLNPRGTGSFAMNPTANQQFGAYSWAEGKGCTASGASSHAEGFYCTASGSYSHAEGTNCTASGAYSHAEGFYCTASGSYSHVQGKHNIEDTEDKYAHIVGNGSHSGRSNAHTLDWDGNAWFAGSVEGTAIILPSPSGKQFKITVDDAGALTATAVT